MKRCLLLIGLFLLFINLSYGQMTLTHSFSGATFTGNNLYQVEVVNLSLSGKKYAVIRDQESTNNPDTIFYYNLDFSLWRTIPCPQIPGYTGVFFFAYGPPLNACVSYCSETLFNIDTLLEAAVYYQESASPYWERMYIINENGILTDSIVNMPPGSLMQVHEINSTTFVASVSTTTGAQVYSLPGTLPCDACGGALGLSKVEDKPQNILSLPIPNPSKDQVKITFTLPDGVSRAELDIYNTSGQKIKSYQVDNRFGFIMVDNSQLAPGMYYYNIVANGLVSSSQKMLVIK